MTWEKGYEKDKWQETSPCGNGSIIKTRNNKTDLKLVHYQYQQSQWNKHPSMNQIIVRIYPKNWKVLIEVSILTDDKQRPATEVIELMLKRWVQENDFKYLIKHFGIDQTKLLLSQNDQECPGMRGPGSVLAVGISQVLSQTQAGMVG